MSIISEALKKANSERHSGPVPSAVGTTGPGRLRWVSVAVLALLVLPFAIPRFLDRRESPAALPLADAPGSVPSPGLAQVSIETAPLPSAAVLASSANAAISAAPARLQGIVWTENKGYYAILNNEVIREGSRVGEMRVTRITPAGVVLTDGEKTEFIEKSF